MATIVRRLGKNGQLSYRAQVRRKGAPPLSATFTKLSDAKQWVQITEAAIVEGRHFTATEAKRHTLADLIERYLVDVMPHKRPSTSYTQTLHLVWWQAQLGHALLSDITPAHVIEYRDRLAQGHALATVNRYLMADIPQTLDGMRAIFGVGRLHAAFVLRFIHAAQVDVRCFRLVVACQLFEP